MEGMPAPHVSVEQQILQYYESGQEANRLESPFSRWEKLRTLDLLDRFLPRAPALILDVGGAAGAYAFPLATKDYVVDLIDPVPLHVEQARQRAAMDQRVPRSFQVGDARAIPCEDGAADAVLFFGPLYHLTDFNERLKAICEARRVLRTGAWSQGATPAARERGSIRTGHHGRPVDRFERLVLHAVQVNILDPADHFHPRYGGELAQAFAGRGSIKSVNAEKQLLRGRASSPSSFLLV
jgi:SAM-dependent methyltransferase